MECKVFRLYSNGTRVSPAVMEKTPITGRLVYWPRLRHDQIRLTVFTAQLLQLRGDDCLIPPLDSAVLMRVNERGLLLAGQEVIARSASRNSHREYYRQAWVIKPLAGATRV